MKFSKPGTLGFGLMVAILLLALVAPGCTKKESCPIPPAGSHVGTKAGKSDVFKQTAKSLQQDCVRLGNCTCTIDGLASSCALAFACLDAGFCELEKAQN